jgi:hypothetical protein
MDHVVNVTAHTRGLRTGQYEQCARLYREVVPRGLSDYAAGKALFDWSYERQHGHLPAVGDSWPGHPCVGELEWQARGQYWYGRIRRCRALGFLPPL